MIHVTCHVLNLARWLWTVWMVLFWFYLVNSILPTTFCSSSGQLGSQTSAVWCSRQKSRDIHACRCLPSDWFLSKHDLRSNLSITTVYKHTDTEECWWPETTTVHMCHFWVWQQGFQPSLVEPGTCQRTETWNGNPDLECWLCGLQKPCIVVMSTPPPNMEDVLK